MVEAKKSKEEVHDDSRKSGESLTMKRVLFKPKKEAQEWVQMRNLFWTMCKEKDKCCKLIIDNESTDNSFSIEMVDKMGLKSVTHPTTYRVSWMQKGHQVLVNE